ncbi:MAG: hypothetical protein AMJ89_01080 [candidate division Zixibacteria bacterium SM23_73]|nr:MAG: hypothetical protein AMJ89_01080 [candidate division Zixibacteria bacterium SM23_73]
MKNRIRICFLIISVSFLLMISTFAQDAFNLRSVTAGINITQENFRLVLKKTKTFLDKGRDILERRGFTLEGVRLATNPFYLYTKGLSVKETLDFIKKINDFTQQHRIALSIGAGIIDDSYDQEIIEKICAVLTDTSANTSIVIASKEHGIHYDAVRAAAETIKRLSELKTMANFSFAATANVPSEIPFFPGAYHNRSYNSFSIGTE